MCCIQDVITKSGVDKTLNMLYDMVRRAGREMELLNYRVQE